MRPGLILSLFAFVPVLCLFGCRQRHDEGLKADARWTVPPELVIATSFRELTNAFAKHNAAFRININTTSDSSFAVLSRYAHSGIRSFESYCYERIQEDVWHLRSVHFFHVSDSMIVQVVSTNGGVNLIHDGVTLFSIYQASNQVRFQSESPVVRGQVKP
jgi:hypothetical protein